MAKNLKIPKGKPEAVNQRKIDNTMAKKKGQKDKQNTTQKLKIAQHEPQLKPGMNSRAQEV